MTGRSVHWAAWGVVSFLGGCVVRVRSGFSKGLEIRDIKRLFRSIKLCELKHKVGKELNPEEHQLERFWAKWMDGCFPTDVLFKFCLLTHQILLECLRGIKACCFGAALPAPPCPHRTHSLGRKSKLHVL